MRHKKYNKEEKMQFFLKSMVKVVAVSLMFVGFVSAGRGVNDKVQDIINIAGKQRMLSQRIAKDYLYKGKGVAQEKASRELQKSLQEFSKNIDILNKDINDEEIKNLIAFVQMSEDELKGIVKKPFNLNNAQLLLDLSESMLEGSQYIVDSLKKKYNLKSAEVIDKAGQQRMLAQRIAKYYIAYQLGIKDKNTVEQTRKAVEQFSKNNQFIMSYKDNTPAINEELHQVNKLWKIVHKFYLNIEKGGLPLIVYNTTNDITKKMDSVVKMYVKLYEH